MRQREPELDSYWGTNCTPLEIPAPDGKISRVGGFHPPFVCPCHPSGGSYRTPWLAKVGYERIQEIENPELATKRTRALYKAKGYSDDWIEKRLRVVEWRGRLYNLGRRKQELLRRIE
jgi:hypothetical protein